MSHASHSLDGDGVTHYLFHFLAKDATAYRRVKRGNSRPASAPSPREGSRAPTGKRRRRVQEDIAYRIPDTVVFFNTPTTWFYWDDTSQKCEKKDARDLEKETLLKHFSQPAGKNCDICCTFLSQQRRTGEADSVLFFNKEQLKEFLETRPERGGPTGLLQRFIVPHGDNNYMFQALWCRPNNDAGVPCAQSNRRRGRPTTAANSPAWLPSQAQTRNTPPPRLSDLLSRPTQRPGAEGPRLQVYKRISHKKLKDRFAARNKHNRNAAKEGEQMFGALAKYRARQEKEEREMREGRCSPPHAEPAEGYSPPISPRASGPRAGFFSTSAQRSGQGSPPPRKHGGALTIPLDNETRPVTAELWRAAKLCRSLKSDFEPSLAHYDKAVTFEGAAHYAEEKWCHSGSREKIERACARLVEHLEAVDPMYSIARMVLYFKEDQQGRLWLMFSTSMRIQEAEHRPHIPASTSDMDEIDVYRMRNALTPHFKGVFSPEEEDEDDDRPDQSRRRAPSPQRLGAGFRTVPAQPRDATASPADQRGGPASEGRKRLSPLRSELLTQLAREQLEREQCNHRQRAALLREELAKFQGQNDRLREELRRLHLRAAAMNGRPPSSQGSPQKQAQARAAKEARAAAARQVAGCGIVTLAGCAACVACGVASPVCDPGAGRSHSVPSATPSGATTPEGGTLTPSREPPSGQAGTPPGASSPPGRPAALTTPQPGLAQRTLVSPSAGAAGRVPSMRGLPGVLAAGGKHRQKGAAQQQQQQQPQSDGAAARAGTQWLASLRDQPELRRDVADTGRLFTAEDWARRGGTEEQWRKMPAEAPWPAARESVDTILEQFDDLMYCVYSDAALHQHSLAANKDALSLSEEESDRPGCKVRAAVQTLEQERALLELLVAFPGDFHFILPAAMVSLLIPAFTEQLEHCRVHVFSLADEYERYVDKMSDVISKDVRCPGTKDDERQKKLAEQEDRQATFELLKQEQAMQQRAKRGPPQAADGTVCLLIRDGDAIAQGKHRLSTTSPEFRRLVTSAKQEALRPINESELASAAFAARRAQTWRAAKEELLAAQAARQGDVPAALARCAELEEKGLEALHTAYFQAKGI